MRIFIFGFLFLLCSHLSSAIEVKSQIVWHWEDEFSELEKEKLQTWLFEVAEHTQKTIGSFPFKMHFHMNRMEGKGEPVPWANTWKYPNQAVHFHVDPAFSLEEFRNDWTAPHEMSHLALPYLGEDNSWFAEGFASFLQCQIMLEMKVYTEESMEAKYASKFDKIKPLVKENKSMLEMCKSMKEKRNYPGMYWGGASYFYLLNEGLEAQGTSFMEVMKSYLACCRFKARGLDKIIEYWDELAQHKTASQLFQDYERLDSKSFFNRL